jgi:hypothetical protein
MHWPMGTRGAVNVDDTASLPNLRDRPLIGLLVGPPSVATPRGVADAIAFVYYPGIAGAVDGDVVS